MRKNLTISGAWFIALFCLKISVMPQLSWWWVFLPQMLVPVEAVLTVLLQSRWLKVLYWYNMQIIKMDGRIKVWICRRHARKAYNKANKGKFRM